MKKTSKYEVRTLLDDLGISTGDKLFIHAFLPSLGRVEGGVPTILEAILECLGSSGTLIVPTFTASYRREEVYDVSNSKSFNGAFSEYVRTLPSSIRSLDPLFSMSAIGKDSEYLMSRSSKNCFGHDSIYEKLFFENTKFLGFGIQWNQGYSFFMHLERLAKVPYRKDKVFYGNTCLKSGIMINDEATHFIRREDVDWNLNRTLVCESLVAQKKVIEVSQSGCLHRVFEPKSVEHDILSYLEDDLWCMTSKAKQPVKSLL
jgi:aminoglycoside 3-N-acetyltransferase